MENVTKVKRESKNRIRVEFDRTPLLERLKSKYLSTYFLGKVVWFLFRFILLLGVSYVILFPFYSKIASSFMSPDDFLEKAPPGLGGLGDLFELFEGIRLTKPSSVRNGLSL